MQPDATFRWRNVRTRTIDEQNAVFCSRFLFRVNNLRSLFLRACTNTTDMTVLSLFDNKGSRKYLISSERQAFACAAKAQRDEVALFCLTLAFTGGRISEVLALTADHVDVSSAAVIFRTLKQRDRIVFRAVPVPRSLVRSLQRISVRPSERLWPWGRTTGWKITKSVMRAAGISEPLCKPKALRHAFAIEATQKSVPLNIVQRWLGHARLETTAIYAGALGEEERNLAKRSWESFGSIFAVTD